MVFMREGRTKQRKNAVPSRLHDVAAVVVSGVDHQLECRIDKRPGFFRVEVLHQLHGTLDVGEQRCHRLALPLDAFDTSVLSYSN
jgi:hypothetical protein